MKTLFLSLVAACALPTFAHAFDAEGDLSAEFRRRPRAKVECVAVNRFGERFFGRADNNGQGQQNASYKAMSKCYDYSGRFARSCRVRDCYRVRN